MPRLNEAQVRVVDVQRYDFTGSGPIQQARKWAKENIVGEHILVDSNGEDVPYTISNGTVDKYLSASAIDKSENLGVHLSFLKQLLEVIHESVEAEVHPDYKKGADGKRSVEIGYSDNVIVHRFYGAVKIAGKTYRVKTTVLEMPMVKKISPTALKYQMWSFSKKRLVSMDVRARTLIITAIPELHRKRAFPATLKLFLLQSY